MAGCVDVPLEEGGYVRAAQSPYRLLYGNYMSIIQRRALKELPTSAPKVRPAVPGPPRLVNPDRPRRTVIKDLGRRYALALHVLRGGRRNDRWLLATFSFVGPALVSHT